ncbi:hypothetical protein SERLA73DRAFT_78039 [Serpula lacrymans var. lacrymans S7.3]|uniref:Uncharacterized protein n=1 Tax=Serpula lacrymans var. lacrymans (strain S7.3) TaxID=936435 RepID=F8QBZ9_SERL3|nr:hypothetical protein SERLA73DRAFT_78039 [Serpula lacrymans var. lacrymans S7.3]
MEKNRKRERRRVPTNRGSDQSRDHVQETDLHHGAQPMQDWGRDDSTLSDTRGQNAQVSEDHAMRHEADTPELHGDLSVNQTMSPRMLYKVAREAQIAVNLAREETRILRRKYDDLLNETEDPEISSQQGPPKKQELMDVGSELQRKIKHTKQLGQKFLVLSCVIRGPGSIVAMKKGMPYEGARSTETLDVKWGLQHTTPGMVACAAILARWVLSPDSILKERGAQSGINWHEDFDNYLEYLEIGLGKRKGSVLTIFREWDRILFPHTTSGLGGPLNDEDREEAMKEAMDALNQDVEELPPSDQEHDDDGGVIREGNDLGPGESDNGLESEGEA